MSHAQVGDTIWFVFPFKRNGIHATSLTVTISVQRDGVQIVTGASPTEVDGDYWYSLTTTAAGVHVARAYCADTTLDAQEMEADWVVGNAWVEHLDADVSSAGDPSAVAAAVVAALSGQSVTVASPFSSTTYKLTLIMGDAYLVTDDFDTAIYFNATGYADLSDAEVFFCTVLADKTTLKVAMDVTIAYPNEPQQVRLQLTSAQTLTLKNKAKYDVRADWDDENEPVTLVQGTLDLDTSVKNPLQP